MTLIGGTNQPSLTRHGGFQFRVKYNVTTKILSIPGVIYHKTTMARREQTTNLCGHRRVPTWGNMDSLGFGMLHKLREWKICYLSLRSL